MANDHRDGMDPANHENHHEAPMHLVGDPYFPEDAPADLAEEEDPSEEEDPIEEEDPSEDEDEDVAESDNEGILEGVQEEMNDDGPVEGEESLVDEEPTATPPPSPPRLCYQPHRRHGKSPVLRRTPRMSVPTVSHLDTFSYLSRPICSQKRKPSSFFEPTWLTDMLRQRRITNDPPRFERGESSRGPPRAPFGGDPEDQDDRLAERVKSLEELFRASDNTTRIIERRVDRLEEEEKDDAEAIQTLYHNMGAGRTEAKAMGAHIRALEYRIQVMQSRLDAIEHRATIALQERRQLQEKFEELARYLVYHLGW
ncbi:unnamed protein product [Lactuca saligna]|uniref:Uncharacterized protein n=1 Tax=Lactuca saligna TaxID=75948 RepID=A0AA36E3J0_LACSI|nr:unnamed protein product [Lactuca saligna]